MNSVARVIFLIAMVVFFSTGCTTLKDKIHLVGFENISKSFEQVMLDSDFEVARGFINPEILQKEKETDVTQYEDIKIVEYRVKKGHLSNDINEINQTAEVKYYRMDSLIVRTIYYEQLWKYDDVRKSWILQTGLPKFK